MKNTLLRIGVSLIFLGLFFYMTRQEIPNIVQTLKNLNPPMLAFAVVIFLLTVLLLAWRMQLIFAAEGIRIGFGHASNLSFVGYFFNNFLPTSVGGDIVKAACAARITGDAVKSVSAILMDRICGLFTFIMIPSFSLLFYLKKIENRAVPFLIYSLLGVSTLFFVLLFNRSTARRFRFIERILNALKIGPKARKIYDRLHNFKNHKGVILRALALSVVGQTIGIFVLYVLALAMGVHASPIYFFMLVPVVHLMSMLPSLNGLGIREGAYVYFLSPVIGKEYAAAIGVLWLALLLLLSAIGGMIYALRHDYHIRLNRAAQTTDIA